MPSNSFDSLVMSLESEERRSLLERIRSASEESDDPMDIHPVILEDDKEVDLKTKYSGESILLKIYLYIKSIITSTPKDTLYNDLLIARRARNVGRNYPEMYDSTHNILMNGFYENVRDLRLAADFFKNPVSSYEDDPGESIVTVGSFLIPDIYEKIESEASPYSIPFTREVTNELRLSLIRKQEDELQSMPQEKRNRLYSAVRNLEWLHQFINLPFEKMLAHFNTITQAGYTCPVDAVSSELEEFANVFNSVTPIPPEVIGALYILTKNRRLEQDDKGKELSIDDFREKCRVQMGVIKNFTQSIPVFAIAAISMNSAVWKPGKTVAVEDWFSKFKNEWRRMFDKEWERWLLDRKKELAKERCSVFFEVDALPMFPFRPWTQAWGGVPFTKDYTLGFLYLFFNSLYPSMVAVWRTVVIEGDFILKENSVSFTDACNEFTALELAMSSIRAKLSQNGEWNITMNNITAGSVQTIQSQSRMDSLMLSMETEVGTISTKFGRNCRLMLRLLDGILRLKPQDKELFDTLTNLNRIRGKENQQFQNGLMVSREAIEHSLEILKAVEEIDATSVM